MSYGVIHQFKGGTRQQFAASVAAVHPSDGTLPTGTLESRYAIRHHPD
jgi:hypothetical protein